MGLVCLGFASTAFTNSTGVPTSLNFGCGCAALCSLRSFAAIPLTGYLRIFFDLVVNDMPVSGHSGQKV